jgi:beta-glucanase (GH16 family)
LYCPNLLWEDNFDQGDSLDTKDKWEYQQGNGCDINLCGWGNNELQEYSSDNIWIEDGALIIEARNESGTYTSGRIRTKGKLDFRYGYLEASIKVARGQGMWSAFWALPSEEGMY